MKMNWIICSKKTLQEFPSMNTYNISLPLLINNNNNNNKSNYIYYEENKQYITSGK